MKMFQTRLTCQKRFENSYSNSCYQNILYHFELCNFLLGLRFVLATTITLKNKNSISVCNITNFSLHVLLHLVFHFPIEFIIWPKTNLGKNTFTHFISASRFWISSTHFFALESQNRFQSESFILHIKSSKSKPKFSVIVNKLFIFTKPLQIERAPNVLIGYNYNTTEFPNAFDWLAYDLHHRLHFYTINKRRFTRRMVNKLFLLGLVL